MPGDAISRYHPEASLPIDASPATARRILQERRMREAAGDALVGAQDQTNNVDAYIDQVIQRSGMGGQRAPQQANVPMPPEKPAPSGANVTTAQGDEPESVAAMSAEGSPEISEIEDSGISFGDLAKIAAGAGGAYALYRYLTRGEQSPRTQMNAAQAQQAGNDAYLDAIMGQDTTSRADNPQLEAPRARLTAPTPEQLNGEMVQRQPIDGEFQEDERSTRGLIEAVRDFMSGDRQGPRNIEDTMTSIDALNSVYNPNQIERSFAMPNEQGSGVLALPDQSPEAQQRLRTIENAMAMRPRQAVDALRQQGIEITPELLDAIAKRNSDAIRRIVDQAVRNAATR